MRPAALIVLTCAIGCLQPPPLAPRIDTGEGEGEGEGEGDSATHEESCTDLYDDEFDDATDCGDVDCQGLLVCESGPTPTGGPCTVHRQCDAPDGDPACIDSIDNLAFAQVFSGGYCSQWCELPGGGGCAAGDLCADFGDGFMQPELFLCLQGCDSDDDCRPGYVCEDVGNPLHVCYPGPACGDQLEFGEECDDGNQSSGDGCSNVCHLEMCDDIDAIAPIVAGETVATTAGSRDLTITTCSGNGPENVYRYDAPIDGSLEVLVTAATRTSVSLRTECGPFDTELGCTNDARVEPGYFPIRAGERLFLVVEQANPSEYTLQLNEVPQRCGDGIADGTEVCDVFDSGASTCGTLAPGTVGTLVCNETCDAVSTAACAPANEFTEDEPNDTLSTANDYVDPSVGHIEVGDVDCASVYAAIGDVLFAEVQDLDGVACVENEFDSQVELFDPDGRLVELNDDIVPSYCSRTHAFVVDDPGTYTACAASSVDWAPDGTFDYRLLFVARPAVCGDRAATGSELCDARDLLDETCFSQLPGTRGVLGCSATCDAFDTNACAPILVTEVEPNNVAADATPYVPEFVGALDDVGDTDCVSVTTTFGDVVTVALRDVGDGACASGALDADIAVVGPDGDLMFVRQMTCGSFGFSTERTGAQAICVRGREFDDVFWYSMTLDVRTPVCGDDLVDDAEACDDGGQLAGDGCSPTCSLEICDQAVVALAEGANQGNTAAALPHNIDASCRAADTRTDLWSFTPASDGPVTAVLTSLKDQLVWVQARCGVEATELACEDELLDGEVAVVEGTAGEPLFFFVAPFGVGGEGPYTLTISTN